ncbi:hypothetical protein [Zoogloea sp.]|uniref:hypothetical protein n=1 Tax=Zoogloea sp. TaxID=49181 RepID=UPI0035B3239F
MANRTLGTRQKLVFRGPDEGPGGGPKSPRNPLVVPALQRKAGPHDKTAGGKRQAEKRAMSRQLQRLAGGVSGESE